MMYASQGYVLYVYIIRSILGIGFMEFNFTITFLSQISKDRRVCLSLGLKASRKPHHFTVYVLYTIYADIIFSNLTIVSPIVYRYKL